MRAFTGRTGTASSCSRKQPPPALPPRSCSSCSCSSSRRLASTGRSSALGAARARGRQHAFTPTPRPSLSCLSTLSTTTRQLSTFNNSDLGLGLSSNSLENRLTFSVPRASDEDSYAHSHSHSHSQLNTHSLDIASRLEQLFSRGVTSIPSRLYESTLAALVEAGHIEAALDVLDQLERDCGRTARHSVDLNTSSYNSSNPSHMSASAASLAGGLGVGGTARELAELEADVRTMSTFSAFIPSTSEKSTSNDREVRAAAYTPLLRHFVFAGDVARLTDLLSRMHANGVLPQQLIIDQVTSDVRSSADANTEGLARENAVFALESRTLRFSKDVVQSRGVRQPLSAATYEIPAGMSVDPMPLIKLGVSRRVARERQLESRQRMNETRATEEAERRYRAMLDEITRLGRGADCSPAEKMLVGWFHPLVEEIASRQKALRAGKGATASNLGGKYELYGKYFLSLSPEKLAVLTMHTVVGRILATPTLPHSVAARTVGTAVQAEVGLIRMRRADRRAHDQILKRRPSYYKVNMAVKYALTHPHTRQSSGGPQEGQQAGYRNEAVPITDEPEPPSLSVEDGVWPSAAVNWLGSTLIGLLMDVATVQLDDGAQARAFVTKFHEISAHKALHEQIQQGHQLRETLNARHLPMICPPRPWVSPHEGGLLSLDCAVVRIKAGSNDQQQLLKTARLDDVYESLDILGQTSWAISTDVYDVVNAAWAAGGGIGELPPQVDVAIPPEPDCDREGAANERRWRRYFAVKKKVEQHNMDLHGLRCNLHLQLEVSREFKNDRLYFPHNMDFRGRTYPIPPHLNHLGSDLCRGLLTFHDGEKLGKRGLHWMKIHLANVFGHGVDKRPFDERAQFAVEHQAQIYDSADKPLEGERWWLQAENPWQTLATCFELAQAWRHAARTADWTASEFVSRLPIHQDGTCNGLQHYAALGGDVDGARSVNLLDSNKPQDVYSEILNLVRAKVATDAASDGPDGRVARLLDGRLVRKIIKQTVMTSVYGVTFIGARKQIENAMKDRQLVPPEEYNDASMYIARKTFECLSEMFSAAREIQEWLGDCAMLIAKENKPVRWVTPLGLPVVQPYRSERGSKQFVETLAHRMALVPMTDRAVNRQRQKSAFPPNYIHSLDSSHMMKTALGMNRAGLTFASVHDSYWTHARDVDKMGEVLRDAFVDLHKEELLETLLEQFRSMYPRVPFPPVPERGAFDVNAVRASRYFFN